MFLTTNHLKGFDEAIISRVHFALRFDRLDRSARRNVWASFLNKARFVYGSVAIGPKELSTLEEKTLKADKTAFEALQASYMIRYGSAGELYGGTCKSCVAFVVC